MSKKQKRLLFRIFLGLVLLIFGLLTEGWYSIGCLLAAWFIAGYDILWEAVRNILRGQIFDEKFLMALATCCALGMQDFKEAAAVMLFFQFGEFFETVAVERSRKSISSLMDLRPDFAIICKDGAEIEVEPEEVSCGDVLLVRTGERIPVDGVVLDGDAMLDTSKITGESMPVEVHPGSRVISGSVNLSGVLRIRAESAYAHSTVARILTLVETASEKKASSERLITRFARYYTPCVIGAALLLAVIPPLLFRQPFGEWLSRALTFLVISCPCALVISVPLSYFSGMGAAAKLGVVVKGGIALERLAATDIVVFDKTGTLTSGSFSVQEIEPEEERAELLRLAALCETYSNHPLARAVRAACPAPEGEVSQISECAGLGVTARVDGHRVAVGNRRLMEQIGITPPIRDHLGTVLYVAKDGSYLGMLTVGDMLRENAASTLAELRTCGVKKTVMLTGDNAASANYFAGQCGISEYHAQLLPQDKVERLEDLLSQKQTVAFVGDGVNDAPVLAAADIGIAMGGVGSDAAVEAADIVILKDDLSKLPAVIRIAKKTCRIAKENIAFALGVKAVCLLLGALGLAPMWLAVFADVGVAAIAILNALRALKVNKSSHGANVK